jgi:hypothetical protein
MANILAQKTLDAFPEFLHPFNVFLVHAPTAIFGVRFAWFEFFYLFLYLIIPAHVRYQVLDQWKGLHGLYHDGFTLGKVAQSGHAHKLGYAVDLGGTGSAFTGFAVPSYTEVIGLFGLYFVDGIKHNHALNRFGGVSFKPAVFFFIAAKNVKACCHNTISFLR